MRGFKVGTRYSARVRRTCIGKVRSLVQVQYIALNTGVTSRVLQYVTTVCPGMYNQSSETFFCQVNSGTLLSISIFILENRRTSM